MKEERQAPTGKGRPVAMKSAQAKATPIAEIEVVGEDRRLTRISEFDRVLGGGVIPGAVILIGGDPGNWKNDSVAAGITSVGLKGTSRYSMCPAKSRPRQIKMRGQRLGVEHPNLLILAETSLKQILKAVQDIQPAAVVVDSIQTVYTEQITSAPGSISQVQEVSGQLMWFAKRAGVPVFIIGHVTKEGAIAGPRLLEHIVDTVLYFEGDKGHSYRILRAVKNRFGSTNEIGVFEMKDSGLEEVANPSELFLAERPQRSTGSVVVSSLEGSRPILVELQALVSSTSYAMPKRMANGVELNRVSLLLAVMEKRLGMHLSGQDVYVNVVGGMHIDEPAIDLGIVVGGDVELTRSGGRTWFACTWAKWDLAGKCGPSARLSCGSVRPRRWASSVVSCPSGISRSSSRSMGLTWWESTKSGRRWMWCWRKSPTGRAPSVWHLLVSCVLVAGCATSAPREDLQLKQATAEELTALLRQRESAIQTMKGLFSAKVRGGHHSDCHPRGRDRVLSTSQMPCGCVVSRPSAASCLNSFKRTISSRCVLPTMGRVLIRPSCRHERNGQTGPTVSIECVGDGGVLGTGTIGVNETAQVIEDGDHYRLDISGPAPNGGSLGPSPALVRSADSAGRKRGSFDGHRRDRRNHPVRRFPCGR